MELPKIAMGAWAWGDKDGYFGNMMEEDEFKPIFDIAIQTGLNLWDTATAYSNGESEKILGKFVNEVGREKVIVSTKFTPQMAAMYDNSVEKMCQASLDRMNIDYIDIYWIHNPIGAPEYTKQLIPLLKSSKVKTVGVSNHNLAQIKEADRMGTISGNKEDKSNAFFYTMGENGAPLIDDAKVSIECEVDGNYELENFDHFMCKILATYADDSVLNEKDKINYHVFKPVLFEFPTYEYFVTGDKVGDCAKMNK